MTVGGSRRRFRRADALARLGREEPPRQRFHVVGFRRVGARIGWRRRGRRRMGDSEIVAGCHQGSRIASLLPRTTPFTRYMNSERVPIWMSADNVMPGTRRNPAGTLCSVIGSLSVTRIL